MNLISLKLKNFKGIKSFEFTPNGQDTSVFGANATGKTTLFDSFLWLLFGKDSANKKDFSVKTLENGEPVHGLNHEVEGIFEIEGRTLSLKKVFSEKWTKKRGEAKSQFTGHTTDHFIDGVPVSQKDYTARIDEIAKEDLFKLLTSPTYFNEQLHWSKRRDILLSICGDLTDDEVIASDETLTQLGTILQGRKLDDHRKVIASRRAKINKEIEEIPHRIDENMRGLPDITGIDATALNDIAGLKEHLKAKQEALLQLQSGGEIAQLKIQLTTAQSELQGIKNEFKAKVDAQVGEKRTALTELQLKRDYRITRQISETEKAITATGTKIATLNAKVAQLRAKWGEVNGKQFEITQEMI